MINDDEVLLEPTIRGFLARSWRYGIAETGRTEDEATERLAAAVRLMRIADSRIANGLSRASDA
jgi:hypothetical protein